MTPFQMLLLDLGLACAAIALLIAKSGVFAPVRSWLWGRGAVWTILHDLVSCTFCLAWWIAPLLWLMSDSQANVWLAVPGTVLLSELFARILVKLGHPGKAGD